MAKVNFKKKWVLITGASSGLGREIARYLAYKEEANLLIAARRVERLNELKQEIETASSSKVIVLEADVGTPEAVDHLFKQATEAADIYAIINNAGITFYGLAEESELAFFDKIVDVNLKALMRLSLRFLSYFRKKGTGAVLNVTSEASFVPIPYQAVYSASKHAAQSFTEALYMENRKSGIVVSAFAPGGIKTEMLTNSGLSKKHPVESPVNMNAATAARLAVKTFKKGKFVSVPGIMNKLTVFLLRFIPRKWAAAISEIIYRPPAES